MMRLMVLLMMMMGDDDNSGDCGGGGGGGANKSNKITAILDVVAPKDRNSKHKKAAKRKKLPGSQIRNPYTEGVWAGIIILVIGALGKMT